MAYKEIKLEKGAAQGLYDLWNAGMTPPKSGAKKSKTTKKTAAKKSGKK